MDISFLSLFYDNRKMGKNIVYAGIDPGFEGGIAILDTSYNHPEVFRMPVIKETKRVKGKDKVKRLYDLLKIRYILSTYLDKNSIVYIERVSSMPMEGSVSSFNFGEGYGSLKGIVVGLFNKSPILVSPVTWKKHFEKRLRTFSTLAKKTEIKHLRELVKTLKDKEHRLENKRQIEKLNRQVKAEGKTAARKLAACLYPSITDTFKKSNTDGMAESLLIAKYGRDCDCDKLV